MSQPPKERSIAIPGLALIVAYLLGIGVITVAAVAASPGSDSGGGGSTTIDITLTEFKISGNLTAPAGNVKLNVKNAGSVDHNVTVDGDSGKTSGTIGAGKSGVLDLGNLSPGTVTLICTVPGHKEAGMTATLTVTAGGGSGGESASGSGSMDHSSSSGGTPDYKQMDVDMLASFKAYPAKTEGEGNQILQPIRVEADGTKVFELTAQIGKWEVEPGKVVDAWTYNGTVPAPMIKLDVGDKFRMILHNKLPVNTDIHWHGIQTPFKMDGVAPITQDPITPGGDFTYDFQVDRPYQGMYHPHLHGQMTVPNGMWGVFQVGPTPIVRGQTINGINIPADVKPAVDMPMVLNDAGAIGYSLNGKSFPATAPIVVKEGDWVEITYYNEGLQSHPMHLHQFPQLVVAEDGFPIPNPYWVDTLLIAPGQRYTVMFHADKAGTWAYHCHILNHAERETGMFGMVTAVVVQ